MYNTLALFAEKELLKVLTVENGEKRYDISTADHGHFICHSCGKIYDFEIDARRLAEAGLDGFCITDRDVYFRGICPSCLSNKN